MYNLLNSYTPLPISFKYGSGVWLFDENNNSYLDLIAGMGATILGYSNQRVVKTIKKQANKLIHTSNLVEVPQQKILAKLLAQLTGMQQAKIFFTNSGAESIETAIKLTRLYANSKKIINPKIIVMEQAYHGRTFAALSASDNIEYKKGFEPLLDCFIKIPFNRTEELSQLTKSKDALNIVALLLEPIQGEGGVRIPDPNYLIKVREICTKNNWLMILDEIQTGIGRTGKMFYYQHFNIIPDVLTIAKGLANGIPIGACIINQPFADLFGPKSHGSTFGGNPLSCSTAITTLREIIKYKLWEKAKISGDYFTKKLKLALDNNPKIIEIRGKGLMIGIELEQIIPNFMVNALQYGLLLNVTRGKIIRLLPPLIINKPEIDIAIEKLVKCILNYN